MISDIVWLQYLEVLEEWLNAILVIPGNKKNQNSEQFIV